MVEAKVIEIDVGCEGATTGDTDAKRSVKVGLGRVETVQTQPAATQTRGPRLGALDPTSLAIETAASRFAEPFSGDGLRRSFVVG